jgi:hypothetical protein
MARWKDKTGEQIYAVVAWILSIKCQLLFIELQK